METPQIPPYQYGEMRSGIGIEAVSFENGKATIYRQKTVVEKSPVLLFSPGWHNTNHLAYASLLKFCANHGVIAIYVPDSGSYQSQFDLYKEVIMANEKIIDINRMMVMGHSSGGGMVFAILKYIISNNWGNDSRIGIEMDGYFPQFMDKADIEAIENTKFLAIQFGNTGNGTDPRVVLNTYNLLTGEGIEKDYLIIDEPNGTDHSYPNRGNTQAMQGLLKPLDALIEVLHGNEEDAHIKAGFSFNQSGEQNIMSSDSYQYSCEYANRWHKGSDQHSKSTIDNCGTPRILEISKL